MCPWPGPTRDFRVSEFCTETQRLRLVWQKHFRFGTAPRESLLPIAPTQPLAYRADATIIRSTPPPVKGHRIAPDPRTLSVGCGCGTILRVIPARRVGLTLNIGQSTERGNSIFQTARRDRARSGCLPPHVGSSMACPGSARGCFRSRAGTAICLEVLSAVSGRKSAPRRTSRISVAMTSPLLCYSTLHSGSLRDCN